MREISIRLYITGQTPRSEQAIANLQRICEQNPLNRCEIIIIDVLEQPDLAEEEKIIATPTLVKSHPPPVRRIIGDLSDVERVTLILGLSNRNTAATASGAHSS